MERQIALEILLKFKQDNSYLNLTINAYFNRYDLTRQQKDFITRVVYGTVQNMLLLEYILKPHLHMRVKTYEKMLFLMSLYQHEMMDSIPDYAIINEAVELAKKKKEGTITKKELDEQAKLRQEYLKAFRGNFKQQLMGIKIVDEKGNDVTPKKLKSEQSKKLN